MAASGKAIKSIARGFQGTTVKTSMAKFEAKAAMPSSLIQAGQSAPAVSAATAQGDFPWGVKWCGQPEYPAGTTPPYVDIKAIGKAFHKWDKFTLGGTEAWSGMFMIASATLSSKLPGKH